MAVPASPSAASFSDIQSTFGGSNPISLNEYYVGGGLTRSGIGVHGPNIPSSGAISVDNFRGTNNFFESWSTTINEGIVTLGIGYNAPFSIPASPSPLPFPGGGSMGDYTPDQGAMNGAYTIGTASILQITPKGQPTSTSAGFSVYGPSTGLSNDDLSAFKTITWQNRTTLTRSDASFTSTPNTAYPMGGPHSGTQYSWNWQGLPPSILPTPVTTNSGQTFTLSNA